MIPEPMMTISAWIGSDLPSDDIGALGIVQNGVVGLCTGSPGDALRRFESVSKALLIRITAPSINFALE